jgi:glycosyltransferase involved in cell wall biosynthesis
MSFLTSVKYVPCTEPCFKESEMSAVPPSGVKRTVSVVIPLYNTEKYVAECIGSVLDQTLRDLEVLVVDDGSQDRSAEIVKEIARRDDRVRLLRHPGGVNLGVSRTRRLGITEASGEYIAYLDADDAFEPTKLERQVSLMKAHPACLLCHTGVNVMTIPLEDKASSSLLEAQAKFFFDVWNRFQPEITEYSFLDRQDALRANLVCNSSALTVAAAVRSAAVATRQVFQSEDFVQWILLAAKGPFIYTPERLTRYRVHSASSSYPIAKEYLRYFYSLIEMLLTLHVLTDNPGLRASAESELLCTLAHIRNAYAEGVPSGTADSPPESRPLPGNFEGSSWGHSALELQSQVNHLQAQVRAMSERLAAIRSSSVYRGLVKVRNLLNGIKPGAIKR